MDSPSSTTRISARSSMIDSFKSCTLSGMTIDKEELKKKLLMPQYLRFAMRDSIRLKDPSAGESRLPGSRDLVATATAENDDQTPPESPMVVFINPRSGGRHGPMLKERLQMLMGEEQVCFFFLLKFIKLTLTGPFYVCFILWFSADPIEFFWFFW